MNLMLNSANQEPIPAFIPPQPVCELAPYIHNGAVKIHASDWISIRGLVQGRAQVVWMDLSNAITAVHQFNSQQTYVSLQLCVQNLRRKWNFPINFRTMRKLYERYSGIFQNY